MLTAWYKRMMGDHPLVPAIVTMFIGTAVSQVIPLAAAPILSRLFPPEERAVYTYFVAIAAALATMSTLRYEQAIVLCHTKSEARLLTRAAIRISLVSSLVFTILAFFLKDYLSSWLDSPQLGSLLPWIGLSVASLSLINIADYWLNREKRYHPIAYTKVENTALSATGQMGLAWSGLPGGMGLVFGGIFGQIVTALTLTFAFKDAQVSTHPLEDSTPRTRDLLERYHRMPTYTLATAVLDAVRINLVPLLVGYFYGHYIAGNYGYAMILAEIPVVLLSGAFFQVYYQNLANTPRGYLRMRTWKLMKRGFVIGLPLFIFLAAVAPWFFPIYLGERWTLAGWMSVALTPWLYMKSVTYPLSTIFTITGQQPLGTIFASFSVIVPIGILWGAAQLGWSIVFAIAVLSLVMAVMLGVYCLLLLYATHLYDTAEG